jgi:hypothetical protein
MVGVVLVLVVNTKVGATMVVVVMTTVGMAFVVGRTAVRTLAVHRIVTVSCLLSMQILSLFIIVFLTVLVIALLFRILSPLLFPCCGRVLGLLFLIFPSWSGGLSGRIGMLRCGWYWTHMP